MKLIFAVVAHQSFFSISSAFTPSSISQQLVSREKVNTKICEKCNSYTNLSLRKSGFLVLMQNNKDNNEDDKWDYDTNYPSFDKDDDDDEKLLASFAEKGLGINIGKQMGSMTNEEIADLKAEATEAIDAIFDERLKEIEKMKEDMAKDFEKSKKIMDYASELNAKRESEKLMNKIDAISNKFLSENEALRMGTKQAAAADAEMVGKGLNVGSWGNDIYGNAVTTGVTIGNMNSDNSVVSTITNDESESMTLSTENKILVIIDEKEKMDKLLLDKFTSLLNNIVSESNPVEIETISSMKPAPLGGLNAQTAIFFTSSISDRASVEKILDRILTRIAPAPGKVSAPPTHLVCISSLGTERTSAMPYSMQNMFTKKLDKKRGIEEAIISKIKRRSKDKCPLDYTILKIGNILDKSPSKKEIEIMYGDSLDGDIGLEAAAQTLLQSVALQAPARNSTLSAIGGSQIESINQAQWDDMFLVLDGPELCRIDIPLPNYDEETIKYKFERLSAYIPEWADAMFIKKTSGTGLTTPVSIEQSKNVRDGQSGLKILFKQTNTGSAYKTKSEERELERQSNSYASPEKKSIKNIPMKKQKKEGGLEVIVEIRKALSNEGEGMRLRVRGRRCNMDDDTVIKEISEGVLVKELRKAVNYWVEQDLGNNL